MQVSTYIVDSFTSEKFKGNPAGVCLPKQALTNKQMLDIANELGFSETAFLVFDKNRCHQEIRFFSPSQEIELCGHATLAMAKILFHTGKVEGVIQFKTINDVELVVKQAHNGDTLLMELPAYHTIPYEEEVPEKTIQALGLTQDKVITVAKSLDADMVLIEINCCQTLVKLNVDMPTLKQSYQTSGVVVTAVSDKSEYDFESRCFGPWVGIDEDPVTGSTHAFLSTYWSEKLGKKTLNALQCSSRSGSMQVELTDNNTVVLTGQAQIVLEGVLNLG